MDAVKAFPFRYAMHGEALGTCSSGEGVLRVTYMARKPSGSDPGRTEDQPKPGSASPGEAFDPTQPPQEPSSGDAQRNEPRPAPAPGIPISNEQYEWLKRKAKTIPRPQSDHAQEDPAAKKPK